MDLKKLYYDLNDLLEDICKFLSSEKLANLPQKDKKLAESLIRRSKRQLQEISRIQCTPQNEEYVIMDRKDDSQQDDKGTTTTNRCIPYTDLPAREAESVKCGYMSMKRKILLGFEKMKRVYANIHHDVLLIYYSEKDSKPVGLIDLTNYTAKENPDSNSKNFDLSCDTPGQKTLHFMAPTRDEMIQWVWQINKIHDGLIEPDLESGSSDTEYDVMKEVPSTQEKSNESDELYEELETVKDKLHKSISDEPTGKIEIRPPLPGRIQLKKSPIKVSPPVVKPLPKPQLEEPVVSSNDTDAEKEDPSVSSLPESLQICSGDDEEDTYEVFAVVKNRIKGIQDAEKEITAIDQEDNPEDNYEVFTDLKKKMKDMEMNRIGTEALNTNQCDENEEITPNDLAMKEQMFDGSEDKLRQTKPRIGIKPVVIKRFQVTLASDSN